MAVDECVLVHERLSSDRCQVRGATSILSPCELVEPAFGEVVVAWPGSVRRWLAEAHLSLPGAPAWAPGCAPARSRPPRIVSPDAGAVALLIPGVDPTQQEIPLEADARDAAAKKPDHPLARQWRHRAVPLDETFGCHAARWEFEEYEEEW